MNLKKYLLVSVFLLPGFVISQGLFAAGIATMQGEKLQDRIGLEYLGGNKVRMDVSQQKGGNGYMLVRDGRAYMVSNSDGKNIVMDMAQLGSMASSMGADMGGNEAFKSELIDYRVTGRSETVAGYKGDVYILTWRDNEGTHTEEAVLSSHGNVREFSQAWMYLAETMIRSLGQQSIQDNSMWNFMERERKGILRLGKDFRVVSIESKDIDPYRFTLPAKPMQMPNMGGIGSAMPSQAQAGGTEQQQSSSPWGGAFGQKAQQHSDRQQKRVERKADYAVDRAVDKAVDSALKGVFGW